MADRHQQILALLATRYDHLPEPGSYTHHVAGFTGRDDPYAVKRVQPYGLAGDTHQRARDVDAEIGRLETQTRAPWQSELDAIADANQHPYGWELARRRMYDQFDYRPLDVALEQLHHAHPSLAASSPRGLAFIDARMPDPIRAPDQTDPVNAAAAGRWADPRARQQRDRQIRRWAAQGRPLGEIAADLALSYRQVRRIVSDGDEAAA